MLFRSVKVLGLLMALSTTLLLFHADASAQNAVDSLPSSAITMPPASVGDQKG